MKRFLLIKNIGRLVTMTDAGTGELGVVENACCLVKQGIIECAGNVCGIPVIEDYLVQTVDAKGGVVMPGLIDAHTHLVHGGSRELEAAERSRGKSYEEIALTGGGILSTVRATRKAPFEELCQRSLKLAEDALSKGTTTIEVKSGYGLDTVTELKILEVVKWLEENHRLSFVPTFMGAHAIPAEFASKRSEYVDLIIGEMLPKVAEAGLAKFCDVFVEGIAFSADETKRILTAAKKLGMEPKLHADQFGGVPDGAVLAAEVNAVSAEHLEEISGKGIEAMKEKGVSAVLIPGSTFFLGQNKYAPARRMLDAGLNVALASDYNPGTSPSLDLFLMCTIAVSRMGMTMEEALKSVTVNAAKALKIEDGRGTIRNGGVADLIILDAPNEYYPIYRYGTSSVSHVIKNGRVCYSKEE